MALDRQNRQMPYVSGRMIAIAEHYASKHFGPGTLPAMFTHPAHCVDIWRRYIDATDEYYQELKDIALPVTTKNEIEKGQMWIGYYHQKAEYDDTKQGGYRINAGRPKNDRNIALSVRISQEAMDILNKQTDNKSEYIDMLIKKQSK